MLAPPRRRFHGRQSNRATPLPRSPPTPPPSATGTVRRSGSVITSLASRSTGSGTATPPWRNTPKFSSATSSRSTTPRWPGRATSSTTKNGQQCGLQIRPRLPNVSRLLPVVRPPRRRVQVRADSIRTHASSHAAPTFRWGTQPEFLDLPSQLLEAATLSLIIPFTIR